MRGEPLWMFRWCGFIRMAWESHSSSLISYLARDHWCIHAPLGAHRYYICGYKQRRTKELASTRTHGHITPHVHTQSTLYTCISTHKYVYSKYRVYSIRAKLGHNRGIICDLQSTASHNQHIARLWQRGALVPDQPSPLFFALKQPDKSAL